MSKNLAEHTEKQKLNVSHEESRRREHESARESTMYDKLKKGPVFVKSIDNTIPRTSLVQKIGEIITPTGKSRHYPLIIGEHGTGKTSLIKLAVNGMAEPKGVIYFDVPKKCTSEGDVAKALQTTLGWSPDPVIDSENGSYSSSLLINVTRG
jgi:hypothetical protein